MCPSTPVNTPWSRAPTSLPTPAPEEQRRALAGFALLPSFQDVGDQRARWSALLEHGAGDRFVSGATVAILDDFEQNDVSFPIQTTPTPSTLWDFRAVEPFSFLEQEVADRTLVELLLPLPETARVRLSGGDPNLTIEIESGSSDADGQTHPWRYLSFVIDNEWAEVLGSVSVRFDHGWLPVRLIGYAVEVRDVELGTSDDETAFELRIVTNMESPQPEVEQTVRFGPQEWRFTGVECQIDETGQVNRDAVMGRAPWCGNAPLPVDD